MKKPTEQELRDIPKSEFDIFKEGEPRVFDGGNAGGGKTQKVRERVRDAAPTSIWLVSGAWEPAALRVLQLASATTLDVKYIREDLTSQHSQLCEDHKKQYTVFVVGGCLKCWQENENESNNTKLINLAYRMAKHIRNTDEIPPATWGAQGIQLLAELRDLDPERYEREVKK